MSAANPTPIANRDTEGLSCNPTKKNMKDLMRRIYGLEKILNQKLKFKKNRNLKRINKVDLRNIFQSIFVVYGCTFSE